MTSRGSGLIVNVSSGAGLFYLFNPIYGLGKAACDRMASDCALEMRKRNVAMVSIWPGVVKTELSRKRMEGTTPPLLNDHVKISMTVKFGKFS